MKKLLLFFFTLLSFTNIDAQDYLGLSTGNYSGIQGVMMQPANVADNRYKFEINLVSTNIGFQNNYLGFSRDFFLKNRFSLKEFDTYEEFKEVLTRNKDIEGNQVRFNLSNRLNLPSVMVTTGKKSGIAIGIQSRTGIAVDNLDVKFADHLYNNFKDSVNWGSSNNLKGLDINALNWIEGNFTYGRVLLDNGKHFLKAGVTAKYLGGVSSWYLHADNDLFLDVNNDSTLSTRQSNTVRYGHSESDFSGARIQDFKPDAHGYGFDAGLVYEFRGRINKFKFLKLNKENQEIKTTTRRDKNKYSFKVGVSLLDAGQLTFKSAPAARDFSTNLNSFNIKNAGIKSVQNFDRFIDSSVGVTKIGVAGQEFSVAMATALSGQIDLHLFKGFYVNAMAYMPFDGLNKKTDYRVFTPNYYAVTPRWESRVAGLYVPLVYNNNYNDDKQISAGATLRVGPLFVGTSNMLTLLKKDDIQSANVHLGFKIPVAHGKPSKAAKWFKKFTNEKDETEEITTTTTNTTETKIIDNGDEEVEKIIEKEIIEEKEKTQPIQIIINNYNGGKGSKREQRVIDIDPKTGEKIERTIIIDSDNQYDSEGEGDYQELKNMQEQIEYLKYKLKQKEELLNQIEQQENRIKKGNSSEESKKKIDSLKNEYLFNNSFDYKGADWDTNSSFFDKETKLVELRKELELVDKKNANLDDKVIQIRSEVVELKADASETKMGAINSLEAILVDLDSNEHLALQSPKAHYIGMDTREFVPSDSVTATQSATISKLKYVDIDAVTALEVPRSNEVTPQQQTYGNIEPEAPELKRESAVPALRIDTVYITEVKEVVPAPKKKVETTELQNDVIDIEDYQNKKADINKHEDNELQRLKDEIERLKSEQDNTAANKSANKTIINGDTTAQLAKRETTNLEQNIEVIKLNEEVADLKSQLDDYKKKSKTKKKPKRVWRRYGSNTIGSDTKSRTKDNKLIVAPTVQLVRDTIFVDRTVEKIVEKVVRDTVTNVVQKDRVITKTETKEIDNTLQKLLKRPAYFVLFGVGSTDIRTVYKNELNFYAKQVRSYPKLKLTLTGHADASGNAARNLELSKARAQQVRNYLIQRGVPKAAIFIDFSGDKDPLETNQTKVGKSQNRRVEILFVK